MFLELLPDLLKLGAGFPCCPDGPRPLGGLVGLPACCLCSLNADPFLTPGEAEGARLQSKPACRLPSPGRAAWGQATPGPVAEEQASQLTLPPDSSIYMVNKW